MHYRRTGYDECLGGTAKVIRICVLGLNDEAYRMVADKPDRIGIWTRSLYNGVRNVTPVCALQGAV